MPKTDQTAYIRAYAAERGVPKRTAQDRFKKRHPDVMDWLTRAGVRLHDPKHQPSPVEAGALMQRVHPDAGSPFSRALDCADSPAPPALARDAQQRTLEEHAECEAWLMFVGNSAAAKEAARQNDIAAAGFARTAMECLKAYQQARADRVKAEIESRRLLPVAEYESLLSDARRVVTAWLSLGPELARVIDPANPSRVLREFERFTQDRLNPIIRDMLAA